MKHPAHLKEKAVKLRKKGYSLREISRKLPIAKSTASLWLKNIPLSDKAKQRLEKNRKNGQFQPKNKQWQKRKNFNTKRKWNHKELNKVKTLYNSGLSARKVGEKIGETTHSILSAMDSNNIPRRTTQETRKIQFYNSPLSFSPKKNLTPKEEKLKIAGLMLYWAEGYKSTKSKEDVDFANSDSLMIRIFIKFLRKIYRVDESRLRCLIYCYPSHDIEYLTNYWSKLVKIPKNQFTKPYIRKDGGNTRDKMKHGLLHIKYSDKRLLKLILKEIENLSYNL